MGEEPSTLHPPQISSLAAAALASARAATATARAATATAVAPETQKRKLGVAEFRSSRYFQIRAILRDIRPFFIEVLRTPDFRSSKAAQDILTKVKFMIELSKDMSTETPSSREPKKLKKEPPLTEALKDVHMGKPQEGETHAPKPQAGEVRTASASATVTMAQPEKSANRTEKEPVSIKVNMTSSGRAPEEKITLLKDLGKQLDEERPRTYVIGGSPIGWNFLLFPGGQAVYYGVTKASALLRRAAK